MPTDNQMHRFVVELSHYDYDNIDMALDGTVADEIAQVIIEYLPALKVKVTEDAKEQANDITREEFERWANGAFSDPTEEDSEPSFERKPNGHYKYPGVDAAWCAWQEAKDKYQIEEV